ncbi:hypothetical protein IEN85_00625 [Pelagicoccus sp. NFK12]|uniref:Uncharacterized protein n=1 Tax=Pelagicoccus enzymogenes TaxID=2773457 RepID=A0A927F4I3_9BACT|nr:hypothetical protein [Pelagicoccus enzymogenes]MBD5777997.1 hypothetical protein [Pelagicoccus enzymogenes]
MVDDLTGILEGNVQKRINETVSQTTDATNLLAVLDVVALENLFDYLGNTIATPHEFAFSIPNGRLVFRRTLSDVSLWAVVTGPAGARVTLGMSNAPQLCGNPAERFTNPGRTPVFFADIALGYSSIQARRNIGDVTGFSTSLQAVTYFRIHDDWVQLRFAGRDPQSLTLSLEFLFGVKGGISAVLQAELEGQVLLKLKVGMDLAAEILDEVRRIILVEMSTASPGSRRSSPTELARTLVAVLAYLKGLEDRGEDLGDGSLQIALDGGVGIGFWDTGINLGSVGVSYTLTQPMEGFYAMGRDVIEHIVVKGLNSAEQLQLLHEAMCVGSLDASELETRQAGIQEMSRQFGGALIEGLDTYIGEAILTVEMGIYALGDIGQVADETVPLLVVIAEIPVGKIILNGAQSLPAFSELFSRTAQALTWYAQTAMSAGLELPEPISLGDIFGDILKIPSNPGIVQQPRGDAPPLPSAGDWAELLTPLMDDVTVSFRFGLVVIEDVSLGNIVRLSAAAVDVPLKIMVAAIESAIAYSEQPLVNALRSILVRGIFGAEDLFYLNMKRLSIGFSGRFGANGSVGLEAAAGAGGSISFDGRLKASTFLLLDDDPQYDEPDGTLLAGVEIPITFSLAGGVSMGESVEFTTEGGLTAGGNLIGLTVKDWGDELPVPAGLRVAGFELLDFKGANTQDEIIEGSGWLLLPTGGLVQATHFKLDAQGKVLSGTWKGVVELGPFGTLDVVSGTITNDGLVGDFQIQIGGNSLAADFLLRSNGLLFGDAAGNLNLGGFALADLNLSLTKEGVFAGTATTNVLGASSQSDVFVSLAGSPKVTIETRSQFADNWVDLSLDLSASGSSGIAKVRVFPNTLDFNMVGDANGSLIGSYIGSISAPWGYDFNASLTLDTNGITGSGTTTILGSTFTSSNLKVLPNGWMEGSFSGTLAVDGQQLVLNKLDIVGNRLEGTTAINIAGQTGLELLLTVEPGLVSGVLKNTISLYGAGGSEVWVRISDRIEVFGRVDLTFFDQLANVMTGQLLAGIGDTQETLRREQEALEEFKGELDEFDRQLAELEDSIRNEQMALKDGAQKAYDDAETALEDAERELRDAIGNIASAVSDALAAELAKKDEAFQVARAALSLAQGEVNKIDGDIRALDGWYNSLDAIGKAFHFIGYNIARGTLLGVMEGATFALGEAQKVFDTAKAALDVVQNELEEQNALLAIKEGWEKTVAEAENIRDDAKNKVDTIAATILNPKIDPRYIALALGRQVIEFSINAAQNAISVASAALDGVSGLVGYIDAFGQSALVKVNHVRFRSYLADLNVGRAQLTVEALVAGQPRIFTVTYNFTGINNPADLALAARQLGGELYPSADWSVSAWTGDADSGVSSSSVIWAYNLNSSAAATVNGVSFSAVQGVLPAVGGAFSTQGFDAPFPNDDNSLTAAADGSSVLARDFVYNGKPGVVTFEGLTPGVSYIANFYSVGWDEDYERANTFAGSGGSSYGVEQNTFGNNKGIRIEHSFTATDETYTVTITPFGIDTFHLYALSLSSQSPIVTEIDLWLQDQFQADYSNPRIAGRTADPDGDFLTNLMEYALGTDPRVADAEAYRSPAFVLSNGELKGVELSFPYRSDLGEIIYRVQHSKDLKNWTTAFSLNPETGETTQATGVVSDIDETVRVVIIQIPDLSAIQDANFWRLSIQLP